MNGSPDLPEQGKVALVTGAARGIGLSTARLFHETGWRLAVVDIDEVELNKIAPSMPDALELPYDVSKPDQVEEIISETIRSFGRIDTLINNAGLADFGPISETGFDRWQRVMETNLDGPYLMVQAATEALKNTQGSVVNVASISGLRASTLRVAYGTSKAAVIQLTKQQAVELGEFGIRVNAVAPGPVRTKLAMAVHTQEIIDAYHDAVPLNRYGTEREIAEAIVFLASNRASYITGQCLAADGGFEATGIGLPALRK